MPSVYQVDNFIQPTKFVDLYMIKDLQNTTTSFRGLGILDAGGIAPSDMLELGISGSSSSAPPSPTQSKLLFSSGYMLIITSQLEDIIQNQILCNAQIKKLEDRVNPYVSGEIYSVVRTL